MKHEVTHQEIYDRLIVLEGKVDMLDTNTKDVVSAFASARGAFSVLEWIGKIAKPILIIGGVCSAIALYWAEHFKR